MNDVIFVQETHSTPYFEARWRNEWRGRIIFSHGTYRTRGAMILICKKVKIKNNKTYVDPEGRYVLADISHANNKYTLANLYAPK